MKKMFHDGFDLSSPPGLVPELLACRACLATDTKLYELGGELKEAYECLMGIPLTTNFVRTVDRVSHKLLPKLTISSENKIIHIVHNTDKDHNKSNDIGKSINSDTDGLNDVLNDFDEITTTLNDVDMDLSDRDFDDINDGSTFIDRAKNFSDDVEDLFRGKGINNDLSDINKGISDIISRVFKGKDKISKKSIEDTATVKKSNEDTFRDAEEVINAINDNLTSELNINDVSINTTDLNDTDSNLVDTFNNFIMDRDYLDENLLETGEVTKNVIARKTEEESLLREIIPNIAKKGKKLRSKETKNINTKNLKPVKNLSKVKEINRLAEAKYRTKGKESDNDNTVDNETDSETSEANDFKIKAELSKEFLKFGEDFNFRIYELNEEEQLEELQKKRERELYVQALYKCVECAKGFRSLETYQNHMKVHSPSYGPFACRICGTRHKTAARRRRHEDAHRLKYCCVRCACVARTREQAEAHFLWHSGKTYKCEYCGEAFGKLSTHLSHVRLRHPGACSWCARCGEGFLGALGLRLHTRRKHPVSKTQESVECYCFKCRIQFCNTDAFRRHEEAASGCRKDVRACVECEESFQSDEMLSDHQRRSHTHVPVKCLQCDLTFASLASCGTHSARAHGRPARARPAAHVTRTADNKFVCELCGKKYSSAAALSYHNRSHTGERPYPCPFCPKAFAFNHTLQAHVRTHTGERPYRCAQCARAFNNANNLARHRKSVHLGQKQYSRCSVCLKWFSSPSAARLHVASVHHRQPWPRRNKMTSSK